VVRHLGTLRRIFNRVLEEVDRRRPDLAVLVDYPSFNLRLARELRRRWRASPDGSAPRTR